MPRLGRVPSWKQIAAVAVGLGLSGGVLALVWWIRSAVTVVPDDPFVVKYHQVQPGMTPEQAMATFGAPQDEAHPGQSQGSHWYWWVETNTGRALEVVWRLDGRLSNKTLFSKREVILSEEWEWDDEARDPFWKNWLYDLGIL